MYPSELDIHKFLNEYKNLDCHIQDTYNNVCDNIKSNRVNDYKMIYGKKELNNFMLNYPELYEEECKKNKLFYVGYFDDFVITKGHDITNLRLGLEIVLLKKYKSIGISNLLINIKVTPNSFILDFNGKQAEHLFNYLTSSVEQIDSNCCFKTKNILGNCPNKIKIIKFLENNYKYAKFPRNVILISDCICLCLKSESVKTLNCLLRINTKKTFLSFFLDMKKVGNDNKKLTYDELIIKTESKLYLSKRLELTSDNKKENYIKNKIKVLENNIDKKEEFISKASEFISINEKFRHDYVW
jgi:hypothetical protein